MNRKEKIQYLKDVKEGKLQVKKFDYSKVSTEDLKKCMNLIWEAVGVGDFEAVPYVSANERDLLWNQLPKKDKDWVRKEQEKILSKYL